MEVFAPGFITSTSARKRTHKRSIETLQTQLKKSLYESYLLQQRLLDGTTLNDFLGHLYNCSDAEFEDLIYGSELHIDDVDQLLEELADDFEQRTDASPL